MLVHKDLQGDAGLPEHTALKGLLAVGNEFISERRDGGEVQRSGEFVEMRRTPQGETIRLAMIFESPDARAVLVDQGVTRVLGDDEDRAGDYVPANRTRMLTETVDSEGTNANLASAGKFRECLRVPRYSQFPYGRVHDVDHTTQTGRGRAWHFGDGEHLLAVHEVVNPDDPRYFMGVNSSTVSTRRTRVSTVELRMVRLEGGKPTKTLMTIETFSGLSFNPGNRVVTLLDAANPEALYDDTFVYSLRAGHLWGRYTNQNFRMDPSASYTFAEPALHADGFLSLVAVHGRAVDALNPDASILKQLTCTFTTKEGQATSTIEFPAHPVAGRMWSAIEVELLRVSPAKLLLRTQLAGVVSPGLNPPLGPAGSLAAYFWTENGGETWVYVDLASISPPGSPYTIVGMMVGTGERALVFGSYVELPSDFYDVNAIEVFAVAGATPTRIGAINGSVFSEGLDSGFMLSGLRYFPRYWPVAFGGGVRARIDGEVKELLWMQFDPGAIRASGHAGELQYPSARAMLMVSADGGATWQRRLLPEPWPQRVGFVASSERETLVIPVYGPRTSDEEGFLLPVPLRIYESRDVGGKWRKTALRTQLPAFTNVDGKMLPGSSAYDIDDHRFDYNRGEVLPLVAIRDRNGDVLPLNPGRPWIADARQKEPENG